MKITMRAILTCLLAGGCATTPKIDDTSSTKIDESAAANFKLKITTTNSLTGLADYNFKGQAFKAQWISCVVDPKRPFIAVFHGQTGFDSSTFCSDWTAQAVLQNGFNAVAVNRPSFGLSTGKDDFSGPQSVAAAIQGMKAANGNNPVIGFWGFDTGTITAAFAAKSTPNLKWLLLGNGFYDLEVVERTTKSDNVKKHIETQKALVGDAALENRSIAWDASGLPKTISIYHSSQDDIAPKAQAEAFNDQLRTLQTKVFFDAVEGVDHEIPWQSHFLIVSKSIKKITQ